MDKRIPVRLNTKQMDFLDKLAKCCRYSGGKKFSKSAFVRCFLRAIKGLDVDLKGVKTEKELKRRFSEALSNAK